MKCENIENKLSKHVAFLDKQINLVVWISQKAALTLDVVLSLQPWDKLNESYRRKLLFTA